MSEQRIIDTVELVAEIITEARRWTTSQDEAFITDTQNKITHEVRKEARLDLIKHLERVYGGLVPELSSWE